MISRKQFSWRSDGAGTSSKHCLKNIGIRKNYISFWGFLIIPERQNWVGSYRSDHAKEAQGCNIKAFSEVTATMEKLQSESKGDFSTDIGQITKHMDSWETLAQLSTLSVHDEDQPNE